MAVLQKGLGKGLDALFQNDSAEQIDYEQVQQIPVQDICANASQPRKQINNLALEELAQSIQNQGILQPIVVRPCPSKTDKYEIIAGERRWRAAKIAQLTFVPAIVRNMSDHEALVIALVENLQREDLNPIEEARALSSLQQQLEVNQDELSNMVGKSRSTIANSIRLLHLDEFILEKITNNEISPGHARTLLALPDNPSRCELLELIENNELTVRQTEEMVTRWKESGCFFDNNEGIMKKTSRQSQAREEETFTASLQKILALNLNNKVRVTGTENKGRISLYYNSEQELSQLLQQIGIQET